MDIIRAFFNFRFSSRNGQSQQKLSKSITHFTIQFRPKNLTHFTNLSSLVIENNMLAQHCQKCFWLYKFSSKHVSVWCQKRYLHCSIWRSRTALLKHFESKCLYTSLYFCKKNFVSKVLSGGGAGLGRKWDWIISLRRFSIRALQNVLHFFILIEIFENSTIFQHLDTSTRPLLDLCWVRLSHPI